MAWGHTAGLTFESPHRTGKLYGYFCNNMTKVTNTTKMKLHQKSNEIAVLWSTHSFSHGVHWVIWFLVQKNRVYIRLANFVGTWVQSALPILVEVVLGTWPQMTSVKWNLRHSYIKINYHLGCVLRTPPMSNGKWALGLCSPLH